MAESTIPHPTRRTALTIHLSAIIGFVIVAIIAHFIADPDYDWTQHALSGLAAQNTYRPRTMILGFIGFGIVMGIGMLFKFEALGERRLKDILLAVYALCTVGIGVFRSAPFDDYPYYSISEATIHSTIGNLSGVFLMAAMVVYGLNATDRRAKIIHFGALAGTLISFVAFLLAYNGAWNAPPGIVQRVVIVVGLSWLAVSQIIDRPAPDPA